MLAPPSSNKKRLLNVFQLAMINVIAIDSLRNLPANAITGLHVVSYYLLAALVFLIPSIMATAFLVRRYPQTGGAYVWVRQAFGVPWGFCTIWLQWIYNVFWYPTILAFIAINIAYLIHPAWTQNKVYMVSMIMGLFVIATAINSFGMQASSRVSTISAIIGTLVPMALIILLGILWIATGHPLAITLSWEHLRPESLGQSNIAFLVIIFFSLMGMEMSAVHAGDVKHPRKNYPRALFLSSTLILVSLTLASATIAIVMPHRDLSIVSGLDQAFEHFFNAFHLHALMPVIISFIIIGSFGSMSAWVIGPTKGMMVAAEDHCLPRFLSRRTRRNVPISILIAQLVIVCLLCGMFLLYPSFNASYWILSDLTAQLALLFYILFFAAAIYLAFRASRQNNQGNQITHTLTKMSRSQSIGLIFGLLIGLLSSIFALGVGFIPPTDIKLTHIMRYELILVGGIIIFLILPWIIYRLRHRSGHFHQ